VEGAAASTQREGVFPVGQAEEKTELLLTTETATALRPVLCSESGTTIKGGAYGLLHWEGGDLEAIDRLPTRKDQAVLLARQ